MENQALASLIKVQFPVNAKSRDIAKALRAQGTNVSTNEVNRALGRFTKSFVCKADSITPNKQALVDAVKAHALANYEQGWDLVVETFEVQDILDIIGESWTAKGAVAKVADYIKPLVEYAEEIKATAF